jgi:hypothetical protein
MWERIIMSKGLACITTNLGNLRSFVHHRRAYMTSSLRYKTNKEASLRWYQEMTYGVVTRYYARMSFLTHFWCVFLWHNYTFPWLHIEKSSAHVMPVSAVYIRENAYKKITRGCISCRLYAVSWMAEALESKLINPKPQMTMKSPTSIRHPSKHTHIQHTLWDSINWRFHTPYYVKQTYPDPRSRSS